MEKNNSLNKNSLLVLGAMVANGFKPGDCNKILELFQPASDSISQHLNQFEQFLLSKNVNYDDLERYNIKGACGYLDEKDGIFIKNTTKSNKYFDVYESKAMCQPNNWNYPTISEFDSVNSFQ